MATENIKIPIGSTKWTLVTNKTKFVVKNPSECTLEYAWFNDKDIEETMLGDSISRDSITRLFETGSLYMRCSNKLNVDSLNPEAQYYVKNNFITVVVYS